MRDKLASKTRQSAGELWSGWAAGEEGERRRWGAVVEVGGTVTSAEQGPAKSSRNPRKDGGLAMVAE